MVQTAIMLKKFKRLFQQPQRNLQIAPCQVKLSGLILQVRRAVPSDLEQMYFAQRLVYHGYSPWSRAIFARELKRHDALYLNVFSRQQLVALIGVHFGRMSAHITNLSVLPTVQERGIGTYLLQTVIALAKKFALQEISLEVRANNLRAQRLYEHLGFQSRIVRKNYYDDIHVDGIDMVLKLDEKRKLLHV